MLKGYRNALLKSTLRHFVSKQRVTRILSVLHSSAKASPQRKASKAPAYSFSVSKELPNTSVPALGISAPLTFTAMAPSTVTSSTSFL